MTAAEAYLLYRGMVDEGSDEFLTPAKFVRRYATVRREWLKAKAQEPETEYIKRITQAFMAVPFVNSYPDGGVLLSDLTDLAFIRSVTCDFLAEGFLLKNKACSPLSDDRFGVGMSDPTRKPDDWFPAYREAEGKVVVLSKTVPTSITIRYLKDLPVPTFASATESSVLTESDRAVDEILLRLVSKQDLSTENNSRYGPTVSREIPVAEANV